MVTVLFADLAGSTAGLLVRLNGRPEEACRLLMEGADQLDRLGRHYDAACAALEAAAAADASGEVEIASARRTRAAALLDPWVASTLSDQLAGEVRSASRSRQNTASCGARTGGR